MIRRQPISTHNDTLFPYPTLVRSDLPELVLLLGASIAELVDAKILVEIVDGDVDARDVLRRQQFLDDLAADLADQPFDRAYAGLARVESHDVAQRLGINAELAETGRASCRERVCQDV